MLLFALSFLSAFIIGSLVEYWVHRLMHIIPSFCPVHTGHHERNTGQGVLGEFQDYVLPPLPVMGILFLFSWKLGISCALGGISYAAFAAYAHQIQHEHPTLCIWMKMPVHYVHHQYDQWHHNFGIGVDWWDRIFGTYQPIEWLTPSMQNELRRGYFDIQWR